MQQSFKSRLLHRLNLKLNPGDTIQVQLTANIAKHVHTVNFASTLLNEGSLALSQFDIRSLAIPQVPEDYDSLLGSLSDIINETSELESIEIGGSLHEILGGDMKPLPVALKLPMPCVWCKCPSAGIWGKSGLLLTMLKEQEPLMKL